MGYDREKEKDIFAVLQEEKQSQTNEGRIQEHYDFAHQSFRCGKLAVDNLVRIIGTPHNMSAVELGAGAGAMSWLLAEAGFDTYMCELEPNSLYSGLVYQHPDLGIGKRIVCDATLPPFPDESLDVIFCKEFAHHIQDKRQFFEMVNSKLKADGLFVLIEPLLGLYFRIYLLRHPDPETHHFLVGLRTYLRELRKSGFAVDRFGLSFYKESSPSRLNARWKRMFNDELRQGISVNRLWKTLYGTLLSGSVVLYARKVKSIVRRNKDLQMAVVPPATLTLGPEYLERTKCFAELLRTINSRA